MNWEAIAGIVGAVAGSQVLVSFVQAWFNKKKTSADAATILLEKTLEWASRLTARIENLEKEVALKEEVITELRVRIAKLEAAEDRACVKTQCPDRQLPIK